MAKTLHVLSKEEMQQLAEELIGLPFKKAISRVRHMDPQATLQVFRVGVGPEILTKYRLPNLGVRVTLVEEAHSKPKGDGDVGEKLRAAPRFVEARVEPLK